MSVYIHEIFPCFNLGDNCAPVLKYLSEAYELLYTYMDSIFTFDPRQEIILQDLPGSPKVLGKDLDDYLYDTGYEHYTCMPIPDGEW